MLRSRPEKQTAHCLSVQWTRHNVPPLTLFLHLWPVVVVPVHRPSIEHPEFLVGPSCGTLSAGHLGLECLYRVTVLFAYVFLDVVFENNDRVRVLFSLAQRALVRSFEPCEDALGVEDVLAREAALAPFGDFIKTNDTSLGKMGRTFAFLDRHVFALRAPDRH